MELRQYSNRDKLSYRDERNNHPRYNQQPKEQF